MHSNTFDSEVLTGQVSASLHSAGVASMEVFSMATLLALPTWIRVRMYKGHRNPPSPTNSSFRNYESS